MNAGSRSEASPENVKRRYRIRLRDASLDDADLLDAWATDPAARGEFNDFGRPREPISREKLAGSGLRNVHSGQLIVERLGDGRPIGTVTWHLVSYGPLPESGAWNIGIALLPEVRGKGYGAEAQLLLAEWLFSHTDAHRVEASADVENVAEQRALEKAGYVREGIQRGAQYRAGAWHDLVTYSRLRTDGEAPSLPEPSPAQRPPTQRGRRSPLRR